MLLLSPKSLSSFVSIFETTAKESEHGPAALRQYKIEKK